MKYITELDFFSLPEYNENIDPSTADWWEAGRLFRYILESKYTDDGDPMFYVVNIKYSYTNDEFAYSMQPAILLETMNESA